VNIAGRSILERATEPIANVGHRSLFERASEPFQDSKQTEWVRRGLTTTGAFVAVSVASAITSAYRRRREGG
jgi:hypothetical protein